MSKPWIIAINTIAKTNQGNKKVSLQQDCKRQHFHLYLDDTKVNLSVLQLLDLPQHIDELKVNDTIWFNVQEVLAELRVRLDLS